MMDMGHMYCTDVDFRKRQWGDNDPRVIWYVLPSLDHINDFFGEKWEPDVLSRGEAAKTGPYAWKLIKKGRDVRGIHFLATNCKLIFITMGAKGSAMQGRSVGAIIFDEEPDVRKLGELETRTASFNNEITGLSTAILVFGFTATSAQDYFKKIFCYQDESFLEKIPPDLLDKYFLDKQAQIHRTCTEAQEKQELFKKGPTIYKRRISIFEAQKFMSGKQGRYTEARARQFVKEQPSKKDIMVRAFGAFEKEDTGGNLYKYFNREIHLSHQQGFKPIYKTMAGIRTAGLDYGSGSNHPGGVVISWISPDFKKIRVIKMWRGAKGVVTTAEDIVDKYIEMSAGMNIDFPFYDFSMADLKTIYNRKTGKELLPAVKVKEGYGIIDTFLKNNMLQLWSYGDEPYGDWAASEFETINHGTAKKDRLDELTDCIRYSLAGVAHLFDLEDIAPISNEQITSVAEEETKTPEDYGVRSWDLVPKKEDKDGWVSDDIDEWGDTFNGH